MIKPAVALTAIVLATPALAIECPLTHAIYEQPGNTWQLRFSDLPPAAAANQIAAFSIAMPGESVPFEGGIYIPNGFGQPLGDILRGCPAIAEEEVLTTEQVEACRFWQGNVYALVDGGIADFPYDFDRPTDAAMAPAEVLLPGFASNVWYSPLREAAFPDDGGVGDAFRLAACAK